MKIKPPPPWKELLKKHSAKIPEMIASSEVSTLIAKANDEYLHWDTFRFQKFPAGVTPELAWIALKLSRTWNRDFIPVLDEQGIPFSFFLTKRHLEDLSFIDRNAGGSIVTGELLPDQTQKRNLVINGLIEEAISSSQIEGASTTRKVARAMIESKRSPKNKDERMIFNNYMAMSELETWKARPLSEDFFLEIHRVLVEGTMEEPDVGRFRRDDDEVVVMDTGTGEPSHIPPKESILKEELFQLYAFINKKQSPDIHPIVKATILHFLIGYLHPFVDGNGRCARALFYWYLLKEGYWMIQYMPISLQIKKEGKTSYDRAFLYVENDDNDLSYFLSHQFKVIRNAIKDFIVYLNKKQVESQKLRESMIVSGELNERQLDVIATLQKNPNVSMDIETHRIRNAIVYETARRDLFALAKMRILKQGKVGKKKYIFSRGERFPPAHG